MDAFSLLFNRKGIILRNTELGLSSSLSINHETHLISFVHMWLVSLNVSPICTQFEIVACSFFRVAKMTKTLLLTSHFVL